MSKPADWPLLYDLAEKMRTPEEMNTLIEDAYTSLNCPKCEAHGKAYLLAHPITAQTDFTSYLLAFHNDIRNRNGVPQLTLTQARAPRSLWYKFMGAVTGHRPGATAVAAPLPVGVPQPSARRGCNCGR